MAARFDFRFTGDKALERNLRDLPAKVERSIMVTAMRKATREVILPAIVANSPVGSPYTRVTRGRTTTGATGGQFRRIRFRQETGGRLKRSIKLQAMRRRRGRVGYRVVAGTRQQLGIRGRGYYPAHLEFGYTAGVRRPRKVSARHQMKFPLRQQQSRWLDALATEVRAGFEREVHP